ncbi:MAG: hypothetical protein IPM26_09550 [Saprospiraceae bacterium]|nr:hypothetical protein [Saprospiraceae bacterium]
MIHATVCIFVLLLIISGCRQRNTASDISAEELSFDFPLHLPDVPAQLSGYRMFEMPLSAMQPKEGVVPYDLNAALFSDYAFKKRFIYIPEGKAMQYHCENVFDFPEGSLIFKFFYYPKDFRHPDKNIRIIETRVLHKKENEWQAYTYVWNESQTDASLILAGDNVPVEWVDAEGEKQAIKYSIPNVIQCKNCHEKSGAMVPIGPAGKHLNKDYAFSVTGINQLRHFADLKILNGWHESVRCTALVNYEKESSGSLDERARSYLDINCAHCHRPDGPARNSGLFLNFEEKQTTKYGLYKAPVAAGRGSGGLHYDIVPGHPDKSILLYRMQSLEPGIMMPESGRKLAHAEGIALIRAWIGNMQ